MFTNLKLIFIGISTIAVSIFAFLFNRRGTIIKEQEVVINSKDQELKTNQEVYKSETLKTELKSEIKDKEVKIDVSKEKNKSENIDKIKNTLDNIEYEVKI